MKMTMFRKPMMGVATLALCTIALSTMPMMAQDNAAPPPQGQMGNGHGRGGEHQLEWMTKQLNLTPDQVTQVKAIDDSTRQQMMALRSDPSLTPDEKKPKMTAIHQASQDKIRALLNDEQKTKYDAMQAEMKARRESHEGGQGGAPPSPQQ
jgi:periplasmic protein CpxP/Spy